MFPGSNRYTFVFVEKTPSWLFQDPRSRNYVERSLHMCSDEWLLQEAKCTEVTTCFDSCSNVWYMNSSLPWGHSSSCLTNDVGSVIWQPTVLSKTTFYFQGDRLLFKVALSNSFPGFRILCFLIFNLFIFYAFSVESFYLTISEECFSFLNFVKLLETDLWIIRA